MDVDDNFCLEEELFGSEGGRESAREWSCETLQEIVAKQTRKRPREPSVKIEEKKKTGPKGKESKGLEGWVRALYAHDENDRPVRYSSPSSAASAGKKGTMLCA